MIGASHVYFVKTVDTSDCGQVQTCAQSDVLTKHGEIQAWWNGSGNSYDWSKPCIFYEV